MRQQLLRSIGRSQRLAYQAKSNAARTFSSSVGRKAEVELTVDGKKVSIEGMACSSLTRRNTKQWLTKVI
jgi:hypothetical protein